MYSRAGGWSLLVGGALVASACGGGPQPPPQAGEFRGGIPDLSGMSVMVLPVQSSTRLSGAPDPELAFALDDRAPEVSWLMPTRLREVLARSPGVRVALDALEVSSFLRGEVRRIGDPLWGDLLRLAAVTDAEVALIPILVRSAPTADGTEVAIEITAVLLNARSGSVCWTGVVAGETGSATTRVSWRRPRRSWLACLRVRDELGSPREVRWTRRPGRL